MSLWNLRVLSILAPAIVTIACAPAASRTYSSDAHRIGPKEVEQRSSPSRTTTPGTKSPIRSVDFSKVSYADLTEHISSSRATHSTLKVGEGSPSFINYGDITGDGSEEAMVAQSIDNRGSAILYYVFVFTLEKGKLKVLWAFETGDRADGGLRQVYADNDQLVIELFGKDRVAGGNLFIGDEALCCPSSFTRSRYKWTGTVFQQIGKEVLENTRGDASPVMPPYLPAS